MATINGDGGDNTILGTSGDDTINGLGGDDSLIGGDGADKIDGGSGDDIINSGAPDNVSDTLIGGTGDDILFGCQKDIMDGGAGGHDSFTLYMPTTTKALHLNLTGLTSGGSLELADGSSVTNFEAGAIYFGSGNDKVKLGDAVVGLFGGIGDDLLTGTHGSDVLGPGVGNDTVNGGKGADWVVYTDAQQAVHIDLSIHTAQNTGGAGTDTLQSIENVIGSSFGDVLLGSKQANFIEGTIGADTMTGGGGADHFVFMTYADSSASAQDHITDLENRDVIDLSGVDADIFTPGVDEAFTLVGHFTGQAGEATFTFDGHNSILSLDVTGDGAADSIIVIEGDHQDFTNFVL